MGLIPHPESRYTDLRDAISKINEETKAGEIAYPNPFGKTEIDELQAQHIWQMLKYLAHSKIIKIYYLNSSYVYKGKFRAIQPSAIDEFVVVMTGHHWWLCHGEEVISTTIKIAPWDLEKAISQIRSEIRIAAKHQIINPPASPL